MPNIRNMPKWLAFLIPITIALAALGAIGCSSDSKSAPSERPTYSSEAGIDSISVSKGTLLPAFREDVRNYGVSAFYTDPSGFAITVTLKDPTARLTIGGHSADSGQPSPIALSEGINSIYINVESEDGRNSNITTVIAQRMPLNTTVYALDGFGGVYPEGTVLTLKDANDNLIEDNIPLPASQNGTLMLGLDKKQRYNIYAKGARTALGCFRGFDPSKEDTLSFYLLPKGSDAYPAEAPIITRIEFADANAAEPAGGWRLLPDNVNTARDVREKFAAVKVTALSKNLITSEFGGAQSAPMVINVNGAASGSISGAQTGAIVDNSVPDIYNDQAYFRTSYRFSVPLGYTTGDHYLSMAVYDMANNRTEQRVYITTTNTPPPQTGDANISGLNKSYFYTAQSQTYGASQNTPSMDGVERYGASHRNLLHFRLNPASTVNNLSVAEALLALLQVLAGVMPSPPTNVPAAVLSAHPGIRGYEVWRSDGDDQHFKKIDTVNYVGTSNGVTAQFLLRDIPSTVLGQQLPFTMAWQWYSFFPYLDLSPDMNDHTTYYYKIKAFNGNPSGGNAPESNVLHTKPMPAFVTKLTHPAHNAVSDKLWPAFKFGVTNPALLSADVSDNFFATLYLHDVTDSDAPVINCNINVRYTQLDDQGNPMIFYRMAAEGDWAEAVYDSGEKDEDDEAIYLPFIWLDDDGAVVVDTDNDYFRDNIASIAFKPGATYEWNVYGIDAGVLGRNLMTASSTNAAFFVKAWTGQPEAPPPPPPIANAADVSDIVTPNGGLGSAFSLGSILEYYGFGSPDGFSTFIISPDAQ